jgi:hypothetical protein
LAPIVLACRNGFFPVAADCQHNGIAVAKLDGVRHEGSAGVLTHDNQTAISRSPTPAQATGSRLVQAYKES